MRHGRRALFLTKQVPYPADSGGRIRSGALVELFRERFDEVHVLGFGDPPGPGLVPPGVVVHTEPTGAPMRGTAVTRSVAVGRWYHPGLRRRVGQLAGPDTHLHVDFVQMLGNLPRLSALDSLDMQNVESDLLQQRADRTSSALARGVLRVESRRLRAWERRAAGVAPVTCVSGADRDRLTDLGIRVAAVARNGADLPAETTAPPSAPEVVFVGALDWAPNVEGLRWFVEQVWPRVLGARPDAGLTLVGRRPTPAVQALAGGAVRVAADVPTVAPYYERAALAVCPLLTGGGSRLKIVEAGAYARATVATTLGAEGLESLVGSGVVLADTAEDLAGEVVRLLAHPQEAAALGRRAREQVVAGWSWPSTLSPLADLLDDWLATRTA